MSSSVRGSRSSSLELRRLWRAQAPLGGHLSPITTIARGPDPRGPTFTGGYDGHVLRWSAGLTRVEWQNRFPDLVNSIAIDPTGSRLAVASADGYVYVVSTTDGSELTRLGPHGDDVNDVAWNPGSAGELAVVCDGEDREVAIWDLASTPARAKRLSGHGHGVFAVEYDRSGARMATASEDGTVRIWQDGRVAIVLDHPGDVETVHWSPDGAMLATGCDDGVLRLWNAAGGTPAISLTDASASVRKVCFSPSGAAVLGASYDGTVRIYDVATRSVTHRIAGPLQWERAAAFDGEGSVLVGSFGDRPVRHRLSHESASGSRAPASLQAAELGSCRRTWGVNALASLDCSGDFAATDGGIVLELQSGRRAFAAETLVCDLAASGDDEYPLAVSDYLGRLTLVGAEGHREIASCEGGPANAVVGLRDGTLATGGYDGLIRRWTLGGELISRFKAHAGPIKSLDWSPCAQVLVAGSSDDTGSAWTLDGEPSEAARLDHEDLVLVNCVAAFARAPWIAVASRDARVRFWNLHTGALHAMPRVHAKSVKTVAVGDAADGEAVVVTGGYDGSICIWRVDETMACRSYVQVVFHGKPGVSSVLVGHGEVTSAGWDGVVASWDLQGRLNRVQDVQAALHTSNGTIHRRADRLADRTA